MSDELNKSIDSLIDELFAEEKVEKSMIKDKNPAKETADEATAQAPKGEKDEKRDAGRPKQISEIPQQDTDGNRAGDYDGKIAMEHSDAKKKEDPQVTPPEQMKKALTEEEYAEYKALKKAKKQERKAEKLQKARTEQVDLIKSAIAEATSGLRSENEDLRKALKEQGHLIKSMANKPQKPKAITNVQAVERFQKSGSAETLSKADLLDIAEELVKAKKLTMEHAIELENTGFIYEPEARAIFEREVAKRS
jgi:hypothetical protein